MTNEELDELVYKEVKDKVTLQEAENIFFELNLKVWNEDITEAELKELGRIVIFLEKENRINEVKERFSNSIKQVNEKWLFNY